ncbi:MAG: DUF58 domain-containing protein [Gammaproteobacteria bacterium]|nr:DUF58 domain-containing protein [Gammaproteobacteria bacterium]
MALRPAMLAQIHAPVATSRTVPDQAELIALAGAARSLVGWQPSPRARQKGEYRAPLKGRGMEYLESRPYQAGDDVRALDWRLTARLGKPHTKLFREERERPVFLVVDLGPTMAFATRGCFKRVQAARAAALLAWKAVESGDRIGGIVHAGKHHRELVPARGKLAAMRLLHLLAESGAAAPESLEENGDSASSQALALRRLRRLARPGSLVFVIGDGRGLDEAACKELAELRRHCELGLLLVHDPLEISLPPLTRPLRVRQGLQEHVLNALPDAARSAYADRFAARESSLARFAREHRAALATLLTTAAPFESVQALLRAPR